MCGRVADAASDEDGSDEKSITVITNLHTGSVVFVIIWVCKFIISLAYGLSVVRCGPAKN